MDTASGLPDKQYLLLINPETYRKSNPIRAIVTQTQGGGWEDNVGMGLPTIAIQGTFGFLGTLQGGPGISINSDEKDGWGLAMELEATFLDFYDRFGTYNSYGSRTPDPVDPNHLPELRFYNYTDADFYVVQVDRFDLSRSVQRKLLYQYDIQLKVLRRVKQPSISEDDLIHLLTVTQPPQSLSFWQKALALYTSVSGVISDVINTGAEIEQDISTIAGAVNGFLQGITDLIMCPIGLLQSVEGAVDGILNKVSDLTGIPHEFINDLRELKRNMMQLGLRPDIFSDTTPTVDAVTASATAHAAEIMTVPIPSSSTAQSLGLVVMNTPETTLFDPSLETQQEIAASVTPITLDDTLESIARKTLGDATAWKRIAQLNGLEYPFIVIHTIDSLSQALQWGSLTADANAGTSTIYIADFTPQNGELLMLDDGNNQEIVTIESMDGLILTLEAPLENSFAQGTTVTRHERMLSVMKPGDQVLIPGGASTGAAITGDQQAEFYTRIYGTDELLADDGTQTADPFGDLATVSGIANLAQALQHRLRTLRGELASLGHPTYGSYLPMIVGKIGVNLWYQRALLEAEVTMMEDPRVKNIGAVTFTIDGSAVFLEADVYPINQTASTRMSILVN